MEHRFIHDDAPYRSAHASTLVETSESLLAAWFSGPRERVPEPSIWLAEFKGSAWHGHRDLLTGSAFEREACWNPVLHRSGSIP